MTCDMEQYDIGPKIAQLFGLDCWVEVFKCDAGHDHCTGQLARAWTWYKPLVPKEEMTERECEWSQHGPDRDGKGW